MSNFNIEPIFSSFLVSGEIDVDHQKIYEWCKTQDKIHATHLKFDEPELKEFYDEIKTIFNNLHHEMGLISTYHQKLERGWLNINPNDSGFTIPHAHCDSTFTSVYYPYIEGNVGNLELLSPNPMVQWVFKPEQDSKRNMVQDLNIFNMTRIRIPPKKGLLVIFPSWIQHLALPTKNGIRVSISVDSLSTLTV
tara:strand:+ start:81 stop:659 length:579 start_codon:yes stop_codon:yes gene_type:complete